MHTKIEWLFPLAILLVAAATRYAAALNQQRAKTSRAAELRALAARLQFDDFDPIRNDIFTQGWGFLGCFKEGDDRYAFNILRGIYHGQSLFVFDHHYVTGSGKNRNDHYGTILMLVCQEAFPRLTIQPQNLAERVAEALGVGNEITFESAEFSRCFCVRSADKKFAYDVCSPRMMEFLLQHRGLRVEIQGPALLLSFEPQLAAGQIESNLQRLIEFRSLLPDYLFTHP